MSEDKIFLLSKCVERRFAERLFYDGILHFGYPYEWIEKAKTMKLGQADPWEGVYSNEINIKNLFLRKCPRRVRDKDTGTTYLRSQKTVEWLCYCLYSVSELSKPVSIEGDLVVYDMSEVYAQDFADGEMWETRFDTAFEDRKAMVVIHRPEVFINKVKLIFTANQLVEGKDYFMGIVHYRTKGEKFTYKNTPIELYHKDDRFRSQQEFRIALNPSSDKVKELMNGGQDVDLGCSLDDCAMLKSHFYKGAKIMVNGDVVRLEVADWSNMTGLPHEMEFVPLITLIGICINFIIKCEMGDHVYEAGVIRSICDKILKDKYNIAVDYESYILGTESMPLKCYNGVEPEVIRQNEEKDTYFYLKNYKGLRISPFGTLFIWEDGEWKRYTKLTYACDGMVVPLVKNYPSDRGIVHT